MKQVCLTYHAMQRDIDDDGKQIWVHVETCATVSMADYIADDLIDNQRDSAYTGKGCRVCNLIESLAKVQDLYDAEFLSAERDWEAEERLGLT